MYVFIPLLICGGLLVSKVGPRYQSNSQSASTFSNVFVRVTNIAVYLHEIWSRICAFNSVCEARRYVPHV